MCTVSLTGCGGTLDEGMPPAGAKADIPLDPKMVDMTGASFADQKKSTAKSAAAARAAAPAAPAEKSE
jgi:hypothetical protein